jgi:hypothetical protein
MVVVGPEDADIDLVERIADERRDRRPNCLPGIGGRNPEIDDQDGYGDRQHPVGNGTSRSVFMASASMKRSCTFGPSRADAH